MNRTQIRHEFSQLITFPFKLTTNGTKFYKEIDIETKLNELEEKINPEVLNNFGIRDYHIVKAGSLLNEDAPPIDTNLNISLKMYLGNTINLTAFYIRPIGSGNNSVQSAQTAQSAQSAQSVDSVNLNNQVGEQNQTSTQSFNIRNFFFPRNTGLTLNTFDCAVCLENVSSRSRRPLRCGHVFCSDCINRWVTSNNINSRHSSCPLCRCSII